MTASSWRSAVSWESHSPPFTVTEHGAMEGADGSFPTEETSLLFVFHLIKGGVFITTEVLQAQRGKFPHPEMLPF